MGGRQEAHSREGIQDQQKEVGLDANVWCLVQETHTHKHMYTMAEWVRQQTRSALTGLHVAAMKQAGTCPLHSPST